MRRLGLVVFSLVVACGSAPPPADKPQGTGLPAPLGDCTRFENVRVFDGSKVIQNASVVVQNGLIAEINGPALCKKTELGEGKKTLLPGLIDAHVHVWNADQLEQAIRYGVTTELDMLSDPDQDQLLKKLVAASNDYADIRVAGNAVTTKGGHGTEYGHPVPTLDNVNNAEDFVAQRVAEKSDYLKIIYQVDSKLFKSITPDMLKAVVASAKKHNLETVVHIDTQHEATDAINAGADGLAHIFWDSAATPAFVQLMKSHETFITPTISVIRMIQNKSYGPELLADPKLSANLDQDSINELNAKFQVKLDLPGDPLPDSIKALQAAHVPILAGTDAPNPGTAHGVSLHGEIELLVKYGLTPTEALTAATSAPAAAFHLTDRGRIAPGLHADLLLVDGDPTTDIKATRNIVGVWRNGVKFEKPFVKKPATEAPPPPPPPKRDPAVVSDFNGKEITAKYGLGWVEAVDTMAGGKSTTAKLALDHGALAVAGVVDGAIPFAWSGALLNVGDAPFAPVDLSAAKELVFKAKGDGSKSYVVMVFTTKGGRMPASVPFVAPKKWKEQHIKLADFKTDGSDVRAIAFVASPTPGKYAFQLDDVELR